MSPQTNRAMPFYAAAAAAVLLIGGGAYSCSKRDNGDRLSDSQVTGTRDLATNAAVTIKAVDPAKRCASSTTYESLKRELFRRAASVRGSNDPALFDRLASAAALRVERPVVTSRDEGLGSIACSASASIDLPPGLAVAGGRTSLPANLAYTLQPAADGSGDVLTLTNADAIVVPLATIGRTSAGMPASSVAQAGPPADYIPPAASPPPPPSPPVVVHRPSPPAALAPDRRLPPPPQTPPQASGGVATPFPRSPGNPSFVCGGAQRRGEIAVCRDVSLSALDRQMAAQYGEAFAAASPGTRDVLRTTAHRFYGFRDNCPDARCIAAGYHERMREIDDIMARDR
ncbi:MAG: hypothetical protein ABIO85_08775 [Sphingomicrobium sp.]